MRKTIVAALTIAAILPWPCRLTHKCSNWV